MFDSMQRYEKIFPNLKHVGERQIDLLTVEADYSANGNPTLSNNGYPIMADNGSPLRNDSSSSSAKKSTYETLQVTQSTITIHAGRIKNYESCCMNIGDACEDIHVVAKDGEQYEHFCSKYKKYEHAYRTTKAILSDADSSNYVHTYEKCLPKSDLLLIKNNRLVTDQCFNSVQSAVTFVNELADNSEYSKIKGESLYDDITAAEDESKHCESFECIPEYSEIKTGDEYCEICPAVINLSNSSDNVQVSHN